MSEGRYEVVALIGPCTEVEAEVFVEDAAAATEDTLGASWMLRVVDERTAP